MQATYEKSGSDFLPAIKHEDGRIEVIHGDALAGKATAIKYAQIEINQRNSKARKQSMRERNLRPNDDWQTKPHGKLDDRYQNYVELAGDGNGNDRTTGQPLKTFDEWLNPMQEDTMRESTDGMRNLLDDLRGHFENSDVEGIMALMPGHSGNSSAGYRSGVLDACEMFIGVLTDIEAQYNRMTEYGSHPQRGGRNEATLKESVQWTPSDVGNAEYVGILEFEIDGEFHNFEVLETPDRLVFGGTTNIGFIESGYIDKEGFDTDSVLQELVADLETYYRDGAEYVSGIVVNQRM